MSVSYGGDSIVFADGSVNASGFIGNRNRIINGAMVIDQRNAGAATSSSISGYTLDRWSVAQSTTGKLIVQQNAGSVTPPPGFSKYLGVTSQSAFSVGAGDYYWIHQTIEGYNIADFNWGTASGVSCTLSFWVRSSLTGSFGGSFRNSNGSQQITFSYTINSANTWEYKTVVIPAPNTGSLWVFDYQFGLQITLGLGTGSTYGSGTAGTWSTNTSYAPTGSVSVVGTSGATFYITGVQLERGSTASSFEYRSYGAELALCQRYYEQVAGFSGFFSNNSAHLRANLKVPKRTQSAAISFSTSPMTVLAANAADAAGTTSTSGGVDQRLVAFNTDSAHIRLLNMSGTGVTNGFGCILTDSQYCIFDAEL